MKIVSWNARGLNSQVKQRLVKRKLQQEQPDIMFIQETKCASNQLEKISKKLGRFIKFTDIASQGWEGGIETLWDSRTIDIISMEATRAYIATEVQLTGNSETYLCINVYGPQRLDNKISFLTSLSHLKLRYPNSKTIMGGDFNMITSLLEKKGGLRRLNKDSELFIEFMESAKLVDIPPKTGLFTWNNRRGGDNRIASRLDRFLISENILLEGTAIDSDILPSGGSDHWPISLEAAFSETPRNKPFRIEKFWLTHPNFPKLIKEWWEEPTNIRGTKMFKLQAKLKHIKGRIKEWNMTEFGNIFQERNILEEKINQIHKDWATGINKDNAIYQKNTLMQQWQTRCQQEEILQKQKSRIQWLKEGEQNTKFFHRSTMDYRGANKILKLTNVAGAIVQNHKDISTLLTSHFKQIAQETQEDRTTAIKEITQVIPKSITTEQNAALLRNISLEEVEEAVRSMPNDKAPGPDDFTINFFKACWPTVKTEIWEVVEDSRCSGSILKSLNSTFLALIPKEEEARTPEKFRPIALCNVIYKIISKVIANRLKPIIPHIISEEKSGYVEGRKILDNILLAQEMIHTLQSRNIPGMMIQLDLSKAFDKINWNYLEATLNAFGFDIQWTGWILALIKYTSFSILVNGSPATPFSPSRGIRQGDPLSPFLFVILMEGLSRIIQKAKAEGKLNGLRPLLNLPSSMQQQFVDDTMLHGSPTVKDAKAYKSILSLSLGRLHVWILTTLNPLFLFFNTHIAIQNHLAGILGFRIGVLPSRYLGAPLTTKPWQKGHWEKLLANMEKRSKHWTHRALNFAGRLVLTKAILQAIPQYMLSILPAPSSILQKIRSIQRSLLWSGSAEKKKMGTGCLG